LLLTAFGWSGLVWPERLRRRLKESYRHILCHQSRPLETGMGVDAIDRSARHRRGVPGCVRMALRTGPYCGSVSQEKVRERRSSLALKQYFRSRAGPGPGVGALGCRASFMPCCTVARPINGRRYPPPGCLDKDP
jgi:hypothetical protein